MLRARIISAFLVVMGMIIGFSLPLGLADTVDNPGVFSVTSLGGHVKVGTQESDINPAEPLFDQGVIDSEGNVTIPLEGIHFSDVDIIGPPPIGNVTVRFLPQGDATGTLNPITGLSSLAISVRFQLIHPLLPPGCGIGPVSGVVTTGQSGMLTGVPYDQATGLATYVDNEFSVPQSSGCGIFGDAIDSFLGLPSDPPNNELTVPAQYDPVLTGS